MGPAPFTGGRETYDRGDKFAHYRRLPSLREYVLVSAVAPRIERFTRRDDGAWALAECVESDGVLQVPSIQCSLSLARVYAKVTLPPPPPGRRRGPRA